MNKPDQTTVDKEYAIAVGIALRTERKKQKIGIELAAKAMNITASYVSQIENGKKKESKILPEDLCDEFFDKLKSNQIDINKVYTSLLQDGLGAFKVSFEELLKKVKL